jgi:hypothetical protein
MIFTFITIFLCCGLALLCFTSNRGRHTFYLGFIFCIFSFRQVVSLPLVGSVMTHASVVWMPQTLLLLVPPLLVAFARSVSGFSNHLYTKWLLLPSVMYLKVFSYFYVAGFVKPETFHKSGLFYAGAFDAVIYSFVTAVWLLVWIHKYRHPVQPSSFNWIQGLLLFIIVYSTAEAAALGASYLGRVMAVQWFINGIMLVFFGALLINGLKKLITPIEIFAKEEKTWKVSVVDMSLQVTTKKELDPKLRAEYADCIKEILEVKKVGYITLNAIKFTSEV